MTADPMTAKERVVRTLNREPVDRVPVSLSPWGDTLKRWRAEGKIGPEEDVIAHFDLDLRYGGWIDSVADLDFESVVLEEDEKTILRLDGNGAKLRRHKGHDATPEHVGFTIVDRAGWEDKIKPHLVEYDARRVGVESYRKARELAAREERFLFWPALAPFEQMHPLVGHETLCISMAIDPDWVLDMATTYARMTILHLERVFEEAGEPDGMFFYEDMGFKGRPFMSPDAYRTLVQPAHKMLFDFAHDRGLKAVVHSCGFVEPLVPGLIEAGMDCLQAMEVKAGMDMPRLVEQFGDRIAFFGGIDARLLVNNDLEGLEAEMTRKIQAALNAGTGYVLHSDHSEPPEVDYETAKFFIERGREISRKAAAV